jgi:cytochrome c oxidase subunit 2
MAPPLARPRKTPRLFARAFGASVLGLLALAAPASAGVIAPDSASPNADEISVIYWVMLAIGVIVALAVNAALVVAVIRFRARRGAAPARTRSGRGMQSRLAAALGVPVIAIFVLGVIFAERARDVAAPGPEGLQAALARTAQVNPSPPEEGEPLVINAIAQQWLWRFEYPGGRPGDRTFSYEELVVPIDTPVILNVTSTDVVHRWWVPALGGQVDAVPGQTARTWFRADEEGTYEGNSAQYSGSGYSTMRAEVEAVSAAEYEQFLADQARELADAQEAVTSALEEQAATETAEQRDVTPSAGQGAAQGGGEQNQAPNGSGGGASGAGAGGSA